MAIVLDGTSGITSPLLALVGGTLGAPVSGEFEYDGKVPYFVPQSTERGIIPGMQYYRLDTGIVGANAPGNYPVFDKSVNLSSNTVYHFDYLIIISKTAGTTSHVVSTNFTGTAVLNNFVAFANYTNATVAGGIGTATTTEAMGVYNATNAQGGATVSGTAATVYYSRMTGSLSVSTGGTFTPNYNLSAAPGGAYTVSPGTYFLIYPVGKAGENTSVGNWT